MVIKKSYMAEVFAERLKELRCAAKLSQMDLAKATGLSQSAIAKWELCKSEPTAASLYTLSIFLAKVRTI